MKPFGIVLLIVGLVIGGAIGHQVAAEQTRPLRNRIQDLETQLTSLQADNMGLRDQVASLQDDKASLERRISELEAGNVTPVVEPAILAVCFSPDGGAASQVIYWLGRANESVHIMIYSFTLDSIGDAVMGAHRKGIDTKVVFEESQINEYSEYPRLAAAGIQVRNDTNPALMHHKVAIIDGCIILVGSFNWSGIAEDDNNEDLLVIRSSDLASAFEQEFQRIWSIGK